MALIGLLSDVHSSPAPVAEALDIFAREGVDQVFCAGDIAGYRDTGVHETVLLLQDCAARCVLGNHDVGYLHAAAASTDDAALSYFRGLPSYIDTEIEGRRVYMVHAEPPAACHGGIKLRDRTGAVRADRIAHWEKQLDGFEPEVLIVGHTHQVFAEQVGNTLIVNPGSAPFNYACAILRLPELTVQTFALAGRQIRTTWKWGDHLLPGA